MDRICHNCMDLYNGTSKTDLCLRCRRVARNEERMLERTYAGIPIVVDADNVSIQRALDSLPAEGGRVVITTNIADITLRSDCGDPNCPSCHPREELTLRDMERLRSYIADPATYTGWGSTGNWSNYTGSTADFVGTIQQLADESNASLRRHTGDNQLPRR